MRNLIKKLKWNLVIVFSLIITFSFVGCGNTSISKEKVDKATKNVNTKITITDTSGNQVEVPTKINNIADAWGAHNAIVAMLGSGNKIGDTTLTPSLKPWLFKVTPGLKKSVASFSVDASTINYEELVSTKPDVLFLTTGNKNKEKLQSIGIPVVEVGFKDFDSMKKLVTLTGNILGEKAKQRASKYNSYLDSKLKMINKTTSKIPDTDKPKVLHIADFSPLKIDGKDTIINSWIKAAGGINVAEGISGNASQVSVEQILKWNPDIIIVSSTVGSSDRRKSVNEIMNSSTWKKIKAVQDGKVYINPDGAFSWDRYSAEEALQVQWAARIIHPDKFKDIDMKKETKWFYKTFFDYKLSDSEVEKILNAEPPK